MDISIIVPVYKTNIEALRHCVASVLGQTNSRIEMILVDDGSPDDCGGVCDQYAGRDARVRVIHKENGGTASARNAGIAMAHGEWIMFVDADDWLERDACEVLLQAAQTTDADIIMYSGFRNYANREVKSTLPYRDMQVLQEPEDIRAIQVKLISIAKDGDESTWCIISTCTKLYRRRLFAEKSLSFSSNVVFSEDSIFNLYAFDFTNAICNVRRSLLHYRNNGESKVNSYRERAEEEQRTYLMELKKFIDARKRGDAEFAKAFDQRVFLSIEMMLTQKFFHKNCRDGYFARRRQLIGVLSQEPFSTSIFRIRPGDLTTNHRIKYCLIQLRMFKTMDLLRKLYLHMAKEMAP